MERTPIQWQKDPHSKVSERAAATRKKRTMPLARLSSELDTLMRSVRRAKPGISSKWNPSLLSTRQPSDCEPYLSRRYNSCAKLRCEDDLDSPGIDPPAWIVRSVRRKLTRAALAGTQEKQPLFLPAIRPVAIAEEAGSPATIDAVEKRHIRTKSDFEHGRASFIQDHQLGKMLLSEFEADKKEYEKNFYSVLGSDSVSRFRPQY